MTAVNCVVTVSRVLICVAIPSLMVWLGHNQDFWKKLVENGFLGEQFPITFVTAFFSVGSILIVAFYLNLTSESAKFKQNKLLAQRTAFIALFKVSTLNALGEVLGNQTLKDSVSVRIWQKAKSRKITIVKLGSVLVPKIETKKVLIIRNTDGLSRLTDSLKDLSFGIGPGPPEGLVGLCFVTKEMVYEEDVQTSGDDYNLNAFQKNKTSDTRFVLCYPLINDENEVSSIVSFDSSYRIDLPKDKEEEVYVLVARFCESLNEKAPELFK